MRAVQTLLLVLCAVVNENLEAAGTNRRLLLWAVNDVGCRTPDRKIGTCVPINQCEPMMNALSNEILDDRKKSHLKRYYCSFENSILSVCCPADPITLEWAIDENDCRTPDGEAGTCSPILQCKPMTDILAEGDTLDDSTRNMLRQYVCKYDGPTTNDVHVCCPKNPIRVRDGNTGNVGRSNLLPAECGVSNSIDRITRGQKSELYEFPWQVALKYNSGKDIPFHCGGALISSRYVLTAAHCIRTSGYKLMGVRLGEYDFNTNPDCVKDRNKTRCAPQHIDIDVTDQDAIVNQAYSRQGIQNDIALIRLPREVEFTDAVGPVCLPSKQNFLKRDTDYRNLTVIGWGTTELRVPSTVLLKVTVPYVSQTDCQGIFKTQITITNKQICAGGKDGKDSCSGDSGGPIMYSVVDDGVIRWVQAGLVSFGTKHCGTETVPAVYTKISQYMDWIMDNMRA